MSQEARTEESTHYAVVDPSEVPMRYLEAASLPGQEPLFDDFALVIINEIMGLPVDELTFMGATVRGPDAVRVAWTSA